MTGGALPMSAPKERLFERLGLSEQNPSHRAIYNKMREEASAGRDRLSLSRENLVEQCRLNPAIQPPYSWDNLSETARHREILNIYRSASITTRVYYDYGSYRSGPNEENWVVQWCLWHVFRYRDNRNKARGTGATGGYYNENYGGGPPTSELLLIIGASL
ncbi:hypothetical protein AOQ84DRAFT_337612 [Glonium stellatum]|uniref:Uncharacterized protein n=1 Tax=Glonium stellatum TaxID=574774 RepID=A0A8E2JV51_9PEZI|nr:hypothetical protein AOQ84DRAFT_337612 [Glonium stellatum]